MLEDLLRSLLNLEAAMIEGAPFYFAVDSRRFIALSNILLPIIIMLVTAALGISFFYFFFSP